MKKFLKLVISASLMLSVSTLFISCETMSIIAKGTARVLNIAGIISDSSVEAVDNSMDKLESAQTSFSLEEEYYIGRSVASSILSTYPLYKNRQATEYVNKIAQVLIINSNATSLYNGYHIAILDTDDINAFATSGGHILITRGFLKCTESEDQLAAVISHELAHIQKNHGIKSISEDRKKDAWKALSTASLLTTADIVESAGKKKSDEDNNSHISDSLLELTKTFDEIIGESVDKLVNSGYSKKFEFEADFLALQFMYDSGYDVYEMDYVLTQLENKIKNNSSGLGKTHPSAKERKIKLYNAYSIYDGTDVNRYARKSRFDEARKYF